MESVSKWLLSDAEKDEFIATLTPNLPALRTQAEISQEELASKLNVSRQAVSRWELGSALPDASNILQLSKLFGVTADYLLNDDFDSDHDVPAVKQTERNAKSAVKKVASICAVAFGLLGNFILYIISRFIEVRAFFPISYQDEYGQTWYSEESHMVRSYWHFIDAYELELLAALFWGLLIVGSLLLYCEYKDSKEQNKS